MGAFQFGISKFELAKYIDSLLVVYPQMKVPLSEQAYPTIIDSTHFPHPNYDAYRDIRLEFEGSIIQFTFRFAGDDSTWRQKTHYSMISISYASVYKGNLVFPRKSIRQNDLPWEEQENWRSVFISNLFCDWIPPLI